MTIYLPELSPTSFEFPDPHEALHDPDGLLAMGGDLNPSRLLKAYQQGIFPWFEEDHPILWWSPQNRMVIKPGEMHISRTLKKNLRRNNYRFTLNTAFSDVIKACANPRKYSEDTWITTSMQSAYIALHHQGHAHSIEVWQEEVLVGGLYGLSIGKTFCGESMFHTKTDTSKMAFIALEQHLLTAGFTLIDCQLHNPHLASLGGIEVPRYEFIHQLAQTALTSPEANVWLPQTIEL